jgi:hypothetical protein
VDRSPDVRSAGTALIAAEAGPGFRSMGLCGMVGAEGLSMPVRWADMLPMERVGVRQSDGDHHEAGGRSADEAPMPLKEGI